MLRDAIFLTFRKSTVLILFKSWLRVLFLVEPILNKAVSLCPKFLFSGDTFTYKGFFCLAECYTSFYSYKILSDDWPSKLWFYADNISILLFGVVLSLNCWKETSLGKGFTFLYTFVAISNVLHFFLLNSLVADFITRDFYLY